MALSKKEMVDLVIEHKNNIENTTGQIKEKLEKAQLQLASFFAQVQTRIFSQLIIGAFLLRCSSATVTINVIEAPSAHNLRFAHAWLPPPLCRASLSFPAKGSAEQSAWLCKSIRFHEALSVPPLCP